ncbi:MAG: MFS transporter [Deltaproteobacteria bacterium]|nr:MFS transporter [Deltaproteobacteria bacterium]
MVNLDHPTHPDGSKSENKTNPSFYYGYFISLFAFIIMVVLWGVFHSFGVYFKPMISEFGWTRALTAAAFSLASFSSGIATAFMGWLNDRFGPRIVMTLCGLLMGLGCVFMSRTQSLWQFYLAFGIMIGPAMGGSFVPPISTVTRWFVVHRGLMTGIVASAVGVGALVVPQISNALLSHFGWRVSYLITGAAAMVIVVTFAQFLKNHPGRAESNPDEKLERIPNPADFDRESISLTQALGSNQFWLFSLTGFCYGYTLFSLTVHVVPHAADLGILPELAAGLLSIYGGLSIVGKITFGKILDRINSKRTMFIGFGMMAIAFAAIVFAEKTWSLFLSVGLFGFFYSACTVSQSPMTAVLFGLKSHGSIMGVFGMSVTFGGALGPFLTGAIYDHAESYQIAFTICIAVSMIGMLSTAVLRQTRIQ